MWIRGLGGRGCRGVLRPSPKPEKRHIFAIGEGSRLFVFLCSAHQWTIDLQSRHIISPRSTRFVSGKRPVNVDDDLEDIMQIRGLGGERLPAASYALHPNLKKKVFLPSEREMENSCRMFSTHQRPTVFIRRLAGAHHISPTVV